MPLFDIPSRETKSDTLKKAKSVPQRTSVASVNNSLTDVINKVKQALGRYGDRYRAIMDLQELNDFVDLAISGGIVSIDFETTGLQAFDVTQKVVGMSIKTPMEKGAVYIPINHVTAFSKQRIETQLTEAQVGPQIKRLVENTATVWHNAPFDIPWIDIKLGAPVPDENIFWDTLIGSHLLNENEPHGLKYLYNKYVLKNQTEDEVFKFSDLFDGQDLAAVPIEVVTVYAGHDAEMTYELYEFQWPYLSVDNIDAKNQYSGISYVFNYIEMPIISVVYAMRKEGICISKEYADKLNTDYSAKLLKAQKRFEEEIDKIRDKIDAYILKNPGTFAYPINYSSPKQLSILLYDILKLEPVDKKNPRGTGEDILEALDIPLGKAVLECRGLEKLIGTYIQKLPREVNPSTGKIHANFNQIGTVTGRFSSSDPNLQNIPSHDEMIRKMFISDPYYMFVGSDYSQQEPRILAHMSGDANLIKAYQEGKDLYAWVASLVYKLPYEQCLEFNPDGTTNKEGKKRRTILKAIVLAIMYSKSHTTVAKDLGITEEEALNVLNTFFRTFPGVKTFIEETQKNAATYGFVETAWGRKRRLPEMLLDEYEFSVKEGAVENFDPLSFEEKKPLVITNEIRTSYLNKLKKAFGYKKIAEIIDEAASNGIIIKQNSRIIDDARRQCVNSRIQGSAGDMIKVAMINLHYNDRLRELGFKLTLTIHDEIIGQCPHEHWQEAAELLKQIMIDSAKERISVPMKCDVEVTKVWTGGNINK